MSRPRLIALLLALFALAVYLPVARHGFILYDDGDYVTNNAMVQGGLTWTGVKWAFTTFHSANWHPLTWLSHMTDCELFGLDATGPHCVNALLHAANTVLVFFLWLQCAGRWMQSDPSFKPSDGDSSPRRGEGGNFWPAAFIAALFAVHPLHVESVAWIAERKDVLSAFFGLLALLCYARYARATVRSPFSILHPLAPLDYWLALIFFACGLMSKPMLVTLPFVMLLLDYWPLERMNPSLLRPLLVEKIPFFALTVASCIVTYIAQNRGAVRTLAAVPLVYRLENAPVALAAYLFKMIWPARLAIIYPMPSSIPAIGLAGSLAVLIFITAAAWRMRKSNPFLLTGWLWFTGMLVPVLGLVKVGDAAMADRYMYLPSIGVFMAVAFGAEKLARHGSIPRPVLTAAAILIVAALTVVTERQLRFWRSDEALFKHAMEVTSKNVDAIINYGVALEDSGQPVEAIKQYQKAVEIAPSSYMAHADLGNLLYFTGQTNEALEQFQEAVKLKPDSAALHDRLGVILADGGGISAATNEFGRAIRLAPANPSPYLHWGMALADEGDFAAATNEFLEAFDLNPADPSPLVEWSKALLRRGRDADAMRMLREGLRLAPEDFQTLTFAARVLASDEHGDIRDGAAALALAQKADSLTGGSQPLVKDVLGMAYAATGQFDEAQKAAGEAIELAKKAGMPESIIHAMRERLQLYQEHQAWKESFER